MLCINRNKTWTVSDNKIIPTLWAKVYTQIKLELFGTGS